MADITSTVTMSLSEYNEMVSKLSIYEEILERITTPAEPSEYDLDYYKGVEDGYRIYLNTEDILTNLSRKSKTVLNSMIMDHLKDNPYLKYGNLEIERSCAITLGKVIVRNSEVTDDARD